LIWLPCPHLLNVGYGLASSSIYWKRVGEEMLSKDCKPNPLSFIPNPAQTKPTIQLGYCTPHRKRGKKMKKNPPDYHKEKIHERNFRGAPSKRRRKG